MRLAGLVLMLLGTSVVYFLGLRGETPEQMRADLLRLLKLPPAAAAGGPAA